jgi:two-component system OmpR family sensor kinase
MLDDYVIIQSYDDKKVVANYNLLSIAIKNILDNGVKYATDKKVEIISTDESIVCFKTKGERLKHKLSYYTEPFNKSDSTSFGLGLYIVKYILDYHNISLEYRHISGYNYFYFS